MRYLVGFICVLALGVMGCGQSLGPVGGSGGDGGVGGDGGNGGVGGGTLEVCEVGCSNAPDGTVCESPAGPFDPAVPGVCMSGECDTTMCEGVDCRDDDPCTADVCDPNDGTCPHPSVVCDDLNDCTVDSCNPAEGCEATSVADGTPCVGGTCLAGVCSLTTSVLPCTEQGILNAVAAGDDTYTFACDGNVPVVTESEIRIEKDVILDGEGNLTVDGNCDHRVFSVAEGVTAELRGVNVIKGTINVVNEGDLTLADSTVRDSVEPTWNAGTLTVTSSTLTNNGGVDGLVNPGTLTIMNSTVDDPIQNDGVITVMQSTLGVIDVQFEDAVTIANSLVTKCDDPKPRSIGYNIESPGNTCGFDQEGDQANVNADDLKLGELADNGGPTMTHALGPGSVAIDHIPAVDCGVTTDQRGAARPVGDGCDVGSFERQPEDQ